MTEDMDRVHHALSGQLLQLANLASHAAELAVQMAARRAREAEQRSREHVAATSERLRADRELAAVVWARSRSQSWLAAAEPDELATVWASARAWAPHDRRAAHAVDVLTGRLADLGVNVERAAATLDAQDAAALARALEDRAGATGAAVTGQERVAGGSGGPQPDAVALDAGGRSAAEREGHVIEVLRAEWADATVEAVVAGDAFGALVHKLSRLEDDGHDLRAVVQSIPEAEIAGPDIRQPAAFAAWLVDKHAAAGGPARVAGEGFTEPAGEAVARVTPRPATRRPASPARAAARGRPEQRER